jgi:hypothetical protein
VEEKMSLNFITVDPKKAEILKAMAKEVIDIARLNPEDKKLHEKASDLSKKLNVAASKPLLIDGYFNQLDQEYADIFFRAHNVIAPTPA